MTVQTVSPGVTTPVPAERRDSHAQTVVWILAAVFTLTAAIVTAVSFPDRISFINDEPRQLAKAFYANKEGTLAPYGLQGNFQVTYGPTATQIYQLILLFTHDPLTIAAVRAGLSAGMTAVGLLWLGRTLRFNPWFAAAVCLAPFLWVFHRIIWDASWAIPIGTLGLAAYAAFVARGGAVRLGLALFCTFLLPFIHPQDILLAAPIGLHALVFQWRSMLRLFPAVLVPLGLVLVLNAQYLQHVRKEIRQIRESGGSGVAQYPDGVVPEDAPADAWVPPRIKSYLSPFLSGRLLSGHKYVDGGFERPILSDRLIRAGKAGSYLIYPLIWGGTLVAIGVLLKRRPRAVTAGSGFTVLPIGTTADRQLAQVSPEPRRQKAGLVAPGDRAWYARRAIAAIAVGSAVFQAVLFGLKRIPIEPQYFFGTFPVHVALAWFAVDWLKRFRLSTTAVAVYGLSVAAITLGSIWLDSVQPLTGSPRTPRPEILPLGMQVEAAAALNAYADTQVMTDVDFYQRFPQALRSLRLLMAPKAGVERPTAGNLVLTFGPGSSGPDTRLVLIEAKSPTQVPPGAKPLDVRPLPNGWLPDH